MPGRRRRKRATRSRKRGEDGRIPIQAMLAAIEADDDEDDDQEEAYMGPVPNPHFERSTRDSAGQ
jgi:hypothetical protein